MAQNALFPSPQKEFSCAPYGVQKEQGLQTHILDVNGTNISQATSSPD